MIKYRLRCARGHEFETWFQNGAAFDKLAQRAQLTCATCGSERVEKAPMAPSLARSGGGKSAMEGDAAIPGVSVPATGDPMNRRAVAGLMRKFRDEVVAKAEYVGPRFAEEARRIEDEEAPVRAIYGEATLDEARALIEDGLVVLPMPVLPDDLN